MKTEEIKTIGNLRLALFIPFKQLTIKSIAYMCVHSTIIEYRPIYDNRGTFPNIFDKNKTDMVPIIPYGYT